MLSMTGYGESRRQDDKIRVEVRLRGVNHRNLDLALRLPEELRPFEARLRELVGERLHRGRVEVALELRRVDDRETVVEIDRSALASMQGLAQELRESGAIAELPSFGDLLRFPDLIRLRRERADLQADELESVTAALGEALDAFIAARQAEGDRLAEVLAERLAALTAIAGDLNELSVEARGEMALALRSRLEELKETPGLPEERIAQEVAVLLERADVREELDRLGAHLASFLEVLELPGAIGKRLDFLAQEILRELNTLAAKARNSVMVGSVVEAKLICEQLREQVQNVE